MDLKKFTERSQGFIQAAQTIATRESHQRLAPEHLLKALLDDDQGLASNLISRAGGAPARVTEALDLASHHFRFVHLANTTAPVHIANDRIALAAIIYSGN